MFTLLLKKKNHNVIVCLNMSCIVIDPMDISHDIQKHLEKQCVSSADKRMMICRHLYFQGPIQECDLGSQLMENDNLHMLCLLNSLVFLFTCMFSSCW